MSIDIHNYRVFVEPLSPALGGGYVSYAPELKGCVSDGGSPDEALRNIYDAIGCWIETAQSSGSPVPLPAAPRRYA